MKNRFKGNKEREKEALKAAQKLKPALRKFIIEEQSKTAQTTAQKRRDFATKALSNDAVVMQASKLAWRALVEMQLWRHQPPPVEFRWTRFGPVTPVLENEMNADIAGFAAYLVGQYQIYLDYQGKDSQGRNPMRDLHLMFFWCKFTIEWRKLIEADKSRVDKGAEGAFIVSGKKKVAES